MNIVPFHKSDYDTCRHLSDAPDDKVIKHLPSLLEWLQDFNWPVAPLVLERIKKMNGALVQPIKEILNGEDACWKYWIITRLLPEAGEGVVYSLKTELQRLIEHPTAEDILEEVNISAKELLTKTNNA